MYIQSKLAEDKCIWWFFSLITAETLTTSEQITVPAKGCSRALLLLTVVKQ